MLSKGADQVDGDEIVGADENLGKLDHLADGFPQKSRVGKDCFPGKQGIAWGQAIGMERFLESLVTFQKGTAVAGISGKGKAGTAFLDQGICQAVNA